MQSSIKLFYGRDKDFFSYIWNHVMINYECCGVIGYWDFEDSNWKKANPNKLYPVQCCVLSNVTGLIPVSENCTRSLDRETTKFYIEKGCMEALREHITRHKSLIILLIIFLGIAYAFIAFFSYCLLRGEPLFNNYTAAFDCMPSAPELKTFEQSNTSLQNMRYAEEPPKKIMRVVSASNPYQTYKFSQNSFDHNSAYPYSARSQMANK